VIDRIDHPRRVPGSPSLPAGVKVHFHLASEPFGLGRFVYAGIPVEFSCDAVDVSCWWSGRGTEKAPG
jgi:hypothetical protein